MPRRGPGRSVDQFEKYVNVSKKVPHEVLTSLSGIEEPGRLADTIAAHMRVDLRRSKQHSRNVRGQHALEHLHVVDGR